MSVGGTKCEHVAGNYGTNATAENLAAKAAAEAAAKAAAEEAAKKAAAEAAAAAQKAAAAAPKQAEALQQLEKGNYYHKTGCLGMQY